MNLNDLNIELQDLNERIDELESINIYDIRITDCIEEDVHISLLGDAITGLLSLYGERKAALEKTRKLTTGVSFIDHSGFTGGRNERDKIIESEAS